MTTTQYMLEEAEEDLNRPALLVEQADGLRRHIQHIRGDQQRLPLLRTSSTRLRIRFAVRRAFDVHDPQRW